MRTRTRTSKSMQLPLSHASCSLLSLMPQLFYFQTERLSFCYHILILRSEDFDFEVTFSMKNLLSFTIPFVVFSNLHIKCLV